MGLEEIRMRLVEKADLVSETEEKEYMLEQLRTTLTSKLPEFQRLDSMFTQLQESRRLGMEGRRVASVNRSRNTSAMNIQSSSALDELQLSGYLQYPELQGNENLTDSDRTCREYDQQILQLLENLYSKIPAEAQKVRSDLEDYVGLQQDLRRQDQLIHSNIITVESRLIPDNRAAEKLVLLARFEVDHAKKALFELVDEEEHLIGLYEQAMHAEEAKRAEVRATKFQKEQDEFERLTKQDKKTEVQLQILRERAEQIHSQLSKFHQVKEKLDFWKARISAKEQIDRLRLRLEKLHVHKMETDNLIIKVNFLEERPSVGGRPSSKSRSTSRRKKFQISLPGSKHELFDCTDIEKRKFPGVSVENLHLLDLPNEQGDNSGEDYFGVKYDNEIGFPTFGKEHRDFESSEPGKGKYFSQEVIGSKNRVKDFNSGEIEPDWQNSDELPQATVEARGRAEIKLFHGEPQARNESKKSTKQTSRVLIQQASGFSNPVAEIFTKRTLIPKDYYEHMSPESSVAHNPASLGQTNNRKLFEEKKHRHLDHESAPCYTDDEEQHTLQLQMSPAYQGNTDLHDGNQMSQSPSRTESDSRFRRGSNATSLQVKANQHNRSKSIESQNISSVSRHILQSNLQSPSALDLLKWGSGQSNANMQDNSYFTQAFSKKGLNNPGSSSAAKHDLSSRREDTLLRSAGKHFPGASRVTSVSRNSRQRDNHESQKKPLRADSNTEAIHHNKKSTQSSLMMDTRLANSHSAVHIDKKVKEKFRREIQEISSKVRKGARSTEASVIKREGQAVVTIAKMAANSQGFVSSSSKLKQQEPTAHSITKNQQIEEMRQSTGIFIKDMKEPQESRASSITQKELHFNPVQSYFLKKQSPKGTGNLTQTMNRTVETGSVDTWQLSNQNTFSRAPSEIGPATGPGSQNAPAFHEAPSHTVNQPYSAASKRYLLAKTANYATGGVYSQRMPGQLSDKLGEQARQNQPKKPQLIAAPANFKKTPSVDLTSVNKGVHASSGSASRNSRRSPHPQTQRSRGNEGPKTSTGFVFPAKPTRSEKPLSLEGNHSKVGQISIPQAKPVDKKQNPVSAPDSAETRKTEEGGWKPRTIRVLHRSELSEQILGKTKANSVYSPFMSRSKSPRQLGFRDYSLKIEQDTTLLRPELILTLSVNFPSQQTQTTHGGGNQARYFASQLEKVIYPSSTTDFLKRIKSSQVYVPPQSGDPKQEHSSVHLPITLSFLGGKKLDLIATSTADLEVFKQLKAFCGLKN